MRTYNHPPAPAFSKTDEAIRFRLKRILRDALAGNAWGVSYEAKKAVDLYAELDLQRALHGLKCGVKS